MTIILVLAFTVGCAPEEKPPVNENPITDQVPENGGPGNTTVPGDTQVPGGNEVPSDTGTPTNP